MHHTTIKRITAAVSLAALALAGTAAHAKEPGSGDQYPNGAENWYAGAVPPPGSYFINYLGHYSGHPYAGKTKNEAVKVDAWFDALRYVHVTDQKLLGASWAWHVIVPLVRLSVETPGGKYTKSGVGDVTINPIILAWHSPEWHFAAGLDFNLPTGAYNKNDVANIGVNYASVEPILAASYLGQNGWELSTKFMYNIKGKNDDTDYRSGNEFHMDYLVGRNFGPWGLGVSGYYLKQTTNDRQAGAVVGDGNKGQVFSYGPSVKYTTRTGTSFIGQWQHEANVENRTGGDKVWFKLILPL